MISQEGLFATKGISKSERSLHTPGSFARQNLLYVQEVGFLKSMKTHRCIRENVDSYLFIIVLEGKGSLKIKEREYELKAGDCALIDCMEHYEHCSSEEDAWRLGWVHFNGHGAEAYYALFRKNNQEQNVYETRAKEDWEKRIGQLLEMQQDKSLEAELKCGELLLQALNCVIGEVTQSGRKESSDTRQQVNKLREYLNEKYVDAQVLEGAEKAFGSAFGRVSEDFKGYFGISIEEYISNRRMNAAKELLRFSIKPVSEIAVESGIGDRIALQQMFREKENMSAEEYRMKWSQWVK